jgi:hypothetical protein
MNETAILEILKQYADGNTLVALYFVFAVVRYILLPLYRNGAVIQKLAVSLQKALDEGIFGHKEVVVELQALRIAIEKCYEM